MNAVSPELLRWGRERARTGPWRGDSAVAYLSPVPESPLPSAAFVRRCVADLASRGFSRVVTSALAPAEQTGFLAAGFEVEERLHLLSHDLRHIPTAGRSRLRKAVPADEPVVLDLDGRAFPPFWRLTDDGLRDALTATPRARFRVGLAGDRVVGYAVTGRGGRRGFLQRLAVDPTHQRRGLGRDLAVDALRWLRRWRVERAVVNTQLGNEAALALYEHLGFRRESSGLCVLRLDVGT